MANDPFPTIPPKFTIPVFKVTSKPNGTALLDSTLPFYYGAIQSIWVYWQVDLDILESYLRPFGMTPARFGEQGAVIINFFSAVALAGQGIAKIGVRGLVGFNETELNILAFASNHAAKVPNMTLREFVTQGDQTKRIGAFRVHVAADDDVAVAAGVQLFFENKFFAPHSYDVPAPNNPLHKQPFTWTWTCHEDKKMKLDIYSATVSLARLNPVPGNMSEWIDFSYVEKEKRVAGSRRNYFGLCETYFIGRNSDAVSISMGKSKHRMCTDMKTLIGKRRPAVVQVFTTPPCIAEAAPYWADL